MDEVQLQINIIVPMCLILRSLGGDMRQVSSYLYLLVYIWDQVKNKTIWMQFYTLYCCFIYGKQMTRKYFYNKNICKISQKYDLFFYPLIFFPPM